MSPGSWAVTPDGSQAASLSSVPEPGLCWSPFAYRPPSSSLNLPQSVRLQGCHSLLYAGQLLPLGSAQMSPSAPSTHLEWPPHAPGLTLSLFYSICHYDRWESSPLLTAFGWPGPARPLLLSYDLSLGSPTHQDRWGTAEALGQSEELLLSYTQTWQKFLDSKRPRMDPLPAIPNPQQPLPRISGEP